MASVKWEIGIRSEKRRFKEKKRKQNPVLLIDLSIILI
jgi:hypothetical protein